MSIISSILIFLLIGSVAGLLMGLLGVGCGLIVVPLLALWLPYHGIAPSFVLKIAIATSLTIVFVTACSSMVAHHRYQRVQWFFIQQYGLTILIGAIIGAGLVHYLNMHTLKFVFGAMIVIIAIYTVWKLLLTSPQTELDPKALNRNYSWRLAIVTGCIGLISAMIGIGGGTFTVPLLRKLRFPLLHAIGTSAACGILVSLTGLITILIPSYGLKDLPAWSIGYLYLPAFILIAPTSFLFAQLGARVSAHLNAKLMQGLLAAILLIIGLKMLL